MGGRGPDLWIWVIGLLGAGAFGMALLYGLSAIIGLPGLSADNQFVQSIAGSVSVAIAVIAIAIFVIVGAWYLDFRNSW